MTDSEALERESHEEMRTLLAPLAGILDAQRSTSDPAHIAMIAERKQQYRRTFYMIGIPAVAIMLVLSFLLATKVIIPEAERLLAPPPAVIVKTFPVRCLSPQQVATLLRPYLPQPQNPRWQAERFDVFPGPAGVNAVTLRAPQDLIDRAPRLIEQFESEFKSACTRGP